MDSLVTLRLMSRDLLPRSLLAALPALGSQHEYAEPYVYAQYIVPDRAWSYSVIAGSAIGDDYEFLGFLLASEEEKDWHWRRIRLSDLERRIIGGAVIRNETFVPGRLTDAVGLPFYE